MTTDPYRNLTLGFQLGYPQGGASGKRASLRITDQASGVLILEVEFTPTQFLDFMSCTHTNASAEVIGEHLTHRIGRVHVSAPIDHPEELTDRSYGNQPSEAMVIYAETARQAGGWEYTRWTRHNFGWRLTGHRFDAPAPTETEENQP